MKDLKEKLKWTLLDFTINGSKISELELTLEECYYIINLMEDDNNE